MPCAGLFQQFAHVPEELRLKRIELNRAETRVHNFVEFVASGRATPALADALAQAEAQVKLSADVASMESAKGQAFTPPPRAWIVDRIQKLNELLSQRTEQSALALRRLTGPVTLNPEKPDVGRLYFRVSCKFDSLNLLHVADGGSNLLHWWRRLQPIRTISRLDLDFAVFTQDAFRFQAIQAEANTMRRLGMSLRAIGTALGVDEKTVRKALAGRLS